MSRKFWSNFRFYAMFAILGTFAVLFTYGAFTVDNEKAAFKEACITMGGTPLIGTHSTKVCLKDDVVLSVH